MLKILRNSNTPLKFTRTFSTAQSSEQTKDEENVRANAKPFSAIPGPSTLTLLTRFLPGGRYHKATILQLHQMWADEYGPIIKLPATMVKPPILMISDPNDFELVFRNEGVWPTRVGIATFDHYRKDLRPDVFKNMGGLLSDQGESWGKTRSIVNPIMLKPSTVSAYISTIDEIAIEFCDRIKTLRDEKNEMPANFLYELNKWALESIASIALDQRLYILDGQQDDENSKATQLIKSVDGFFSLSYELEMLPSPWKYIATPKYKQLMKVFDNLTEATLYYVDKAVANFEKNPSNDNNRELSVLEKLLKVDKHVALVMALDMFMAGVDTTSSTAANVLYYLAKNPEKQEKLRKELQSVLKDGNEQLTSASFRKVPYFRACLKEVLRFAPIVPGTARGAGRDLVIKGYHVPKGTDIAMMTLMLQYDENHFKKPNEFMPERWLKPNTPDACPEAKTSNPFAYIPFGFGPRACVGKRFAEMEICVLMTRLLSKYRIEYDYGPLEYRMSFVVSPISDLKFKLTEI